MNEKSYRYRLEGTGRDNAAWMVEGVAKAEWPDLFDVINRDGFRKLTNGNATYGQPGVGGCKGPYEIKSLLITLVMQ
jgi:hypothetical protein